MPGFDGTGPRGMGPMTGGGRGFCAVPLPPVWSGYAYAPWSVPYYRAPSFAPKVARVEELEHLKGWPRSMKEDLRGIEERIRQIGKE